MILFCKHFDTGLRLLCSLFHLPHCAARGIPHAAQCVFLVKTDMKTPAGDPAGAFYRAYSFFISFRQFGQMFFPR